MKKNPAIRKTACASFFAAGLTTFSIFTGCAFAQDDDHSGGWQVKVMTISMFGPEGQV